MPPFTSPWYAGAWGCERTPHAPFRLPCPHAEMWRRDLETETAPRTCPQQRNRTRKQIVPRPSAHPSIPISPLLNMVPICVVPLPGTAQTASPCALLLQRDVFTLAAVHINYGCIGIRIGAAWSLRRLPGAGTAHFDGHARNARAHSEWHRCSCRRRRGSVSERVGAAKRTVATEWISASEWSGATSASEGIGAASTPEGVGAAKRVATFATAQQLLDSCAAERLWRCSLLAAACCIVQKLTQPVEWAASHEEGAERAEQLCERAEERPLERGDGSTRCHDAEAGLEQHPEGLHPEVCNDGEHN
mmetsp:Transcript_47855/g.141344  ORF Transcript_47855/g.141344 Transcript_47855/m.141344 type:complete len:304 (+) Transcript_47855:151-1062(+)